MTPHEESTMLSLGSRGHYGSRGAFELVARTLVRGPRGVLWNEWTVRLDHEPLPLSLIEHGGLLTMYEETTPLPTSLHAYAMGVPITLGFVAVERGFATPLSTWRPDGITSDGRPYAFVDLSSTTDGRPATIDVTAGSFYTGHRVSFEELALPRARNATVAVPLHATPDVSRPKGVEPWLAIDDEGTLEGRRFRVVGMVSRRVDEETAWDEYCLQDIEIGSMRWLALAEGHWTALEPVEVGLVRELGAEVECAGVCYEAQTRCDARLVWAAGRLPWEVTIGEIAAVAEFRAAGGTLLTKELTENELSWTRSAIVTPDVIAHGFKKRSLPKPG